MPAQRLEKPLLRDHHRYAMQNEFILMMLGAYLGCVIWVYGYSLPTQKKVLEHIENIDNEARIKFLFEHNFVNPDELGIPED